MYFLIYGSGGISIANHHLIYLGIACLFSFALSLYLFRNQPISPQRYFSFQAALLLFSFVLLLLFDPGMLTSPKFRLPLSQLAVWLALLVFSGIASVYTYFRGRRSNKQGTNPRVMQEKRKERWHYIGLFLSLFLFFSGYRVGGIAGLFILLVFPLLSLCLVGLSWINLGFTRKEENTWQEIEENQPLSKD